LIAVKVRGEPSESVMTRTGPLDPCCRLSTEEIQVSLRKSESTVYWNAVKELKRLGETKTNTVRPLTVRAMTQRENIYPGKEQPNKIAKAFLMIVSE